VVCSRPTVPSLRPTPQWAIIVRPLRGRRACKALTYQSCHVPLLASMEPLPQFEAVACHASFKCDRPGPHRVLACSRKLLHDKLLPQPSLDHCSALASPFLPRPEPIGTLRGLDFTASLPVASAAADCPGAGESLPANDIFAGIFNAGRCSARAGGTADHPQLFGQGLQSGPAGLVSSPGQARHDVHCLVFWRHSRVRRRYVEEDLSPVEHGTLAGHG